MPHTEIEEAIRQEYFDEMEYAEEIKVEWLDEEVTSKMSCDLREVGMSQRDFL